jgi:hypothetical protein
MIGVGVHGCRIKSGMTKEGRHSALRLVDPVSRQAASEPAKAGDDRAAVGHARPLLARGCKSSGSARQGFA